MAEKIIINYKFLLSPTRQQRSALWKTLQSCRKMYNEGLELWNECYECTKIGLSKPLLDFYFKDRFLDVHSQVKRSLKIQKRCKEILLNLQSEKFKISLHRFVS